MTKLFVRTVVAFALGTFAISLSPVRPAAASPQEDEAISAIKIENARLREENAVLRERVQLRKENQALRATLQDQDQPHPAKQPNPKMQPAQAAEFAYAADMPVKAVRGAIAPPVYDWTGLFIGGNIGYGWGGETGNGLSVTDPNGIFTPLGFPSYAALGGFQYPSVNPKGVIGGGQIGYNRQTGAVVLGLVADFQGADMTDNRTVAVPALGVFNPENQSHSAKIDWFGTARGRVGYAFSNFLPYISGGLAYGHVQSTLTAFFPTSGLIISGSTDFTRVGWTVGGGFEYGLTRNWTVGLDYLYFDLGHETVTAVPQNNVFLTGTSIAMNQHFTGNILRAVVNYRF